MLRGRDVANPLFLFPNLVQQLMHSNTKGKNDHVTDCPLQPLGSVPLTTLQTIVPLSCDIPEDDMISFIWISYQYEPVSLTSLAIF